MQPARARTRAPRDPTGAPPTPRSSVAAGPREADPLPDGIGSARLLRRIGLLVVFGAIVALMIATLPGLGEVRRRFAEVQPGWLVALLAIEVASCLAYVVAFRGVFCPRLGWRFSYQVGLSEQATNVLLPAGGVGGLALGAWLLRQGGMGGERIARRSVAFFVITSAPNFLCAAVFGTLVATGVASGSAPLGLTLALAALAATGIGLVASLPWLVSRLGSRAGTIAAAGQDGGWLRHKLETVRRGAVAAADGIRVIRGVVRERGVAAGALGYMAFDVAALAAAFTALGSPPPLAAFVFAYVIGQLGGLIPLPGGIGGTDGGLIAALTLYGSPLAESTAAVLAYRTVQLGIPALLGTLAFVQLRRTLGRGDAPAALCEPVTGPLPIFTLPATS